MKLLLNEKLIPVVDKIKHLGHLISNKDRNFYNCVDIIKDLKVRYNTISCNFNFLTTSSRMKIFNTNCYCFYGCPLLNLTNNEVGKLDQSWRVCCRKILKLPPRTHCNLIPYIMGVNPPSLLIKNRQIHFLTMV